MKGFMSTLLALLIVLSASMVVAPVAQADDESPGDFVLGLCTGGHQGGGATEEDGPPEGDLEGDPENWLGGQNSVADDGQDEDGGLIHWIVSLFARYFTFSR